MPFNMSFDGNFLVSQALTDDQIKQVGEAISYAISDTVRDCGLRIYLGSVTMTLDKEEISQETVDNEIAIAQVLALETMFGDKSDEPN